MLDRFTACFIGHRTIPQSQELRRKVYNTIENLILHKRVNTFLFGSKSQFNDLCYEQVTKLKEKYPHIKRVYVRAEYPIITEEYKKYLLTLYEETDFPSGLLGAGKASYIKRNYEMIKRSTFCVVYYEEATAPTTRKSGTKIALDYALAKKTQVINIAKE